MMSDPRRWLSVSIVLAALVPPAAAQVPSCGPPEIRIADAPIVDHPWGNRSQLAWSGSGYGMAWLQVEPDGSNSVRFTTLNSRGEPISDEHRLTGEEADARAFDLEWNGEFYAVAWTLDPELPGSFFGRFDVTGAPVGAVLTFPTPGVYPTPSLEWAGDRYGLHLGGTFRVIDATAGVVGPPVAVPSGSNQQLTWNGSEYGLVWDASDEIRFTRLDAAGGLVGPTVRVDTDAASSFGPTMVWTGTEWGVAYHDERDGVWNILFRRLAPDGSAIGEPAPVSGEFPDSTWGRLSWHGTGYGVIWLTDGGHPFLRRSYYARLDPIGRRLGPALPFPPQTIAGFWPAWNGASDAVLVTEFLPGGTNARDALAVRFARVGCNCADPAAEPRFVPCAEVDCGNGLIVPAEACDDGNGIDGDGCSAACAVEEAAENAVVNGDFATGSLDPWRWFTNGAGTAEVVDGVAHVELSSVGTNTQLFQRDIAVVGGQTYRLAFDGGCANGPADCVAAGDQADLRVLLQRDSGGLNYGLTWDVPLTAWPRTYARQFVVPAQVGSAGDGRLSVAFAGFAAPDNRYTLDNFRLEQLPPPSCGDGVLNPGESCDDGDADDLDACVAGCFAASCGDALVWAGVEACDDGNGEAGDGCEPDCSPSCVDQDGDGVDSCSDCDDGDPTTYPLAPQLCDGVDNDCAGAAWPLVPENERDEDGDGVPLCAGDCDDNDALVSPASSETCNQRDDDCDGVVDNDGIGVDSDGDGVRNACDNCVLYGNPHQTDADEDGEGDRCDLDDGRIYLTWPGRGLLAWPEEAGFTSWNAYRGDLAVLKATCSYVQEPGSNPLALQVAGLSSPFFGDTVAVPGGTAAFYLVAGVAGGEEGPLGEDSSGSERPRDPVCP